MKFDFDACLLGLTILICCVFAVFVTHENEEKAKRQYYLQTIDEDGTQWFLFMTPDEHSVWAARRYEKIKVKLFED